MNNTFDYKFDKCISGSAQQARIQTDFQIKYGAVFGEDITIGGNVCISSGVRVGYNACIGESVCIAKESNIRNKIRIENHPVIGESVISIAKYPCTIVTAVGAV
ncbi:hypothetical protein XFPR_10060 [Xylella fastidiosa]|nr:hypothetical protein [Xylella fastidiosa]ALQ94439.1 hypothetical protein XFUD_03935 [Xylella fastidiosa]ALQ97707.1 hypothetical protein XFC3_10395 [Xylella fastidiosa]ALR01994.1 hypothetical protein OY18_06860 [Xylella fastidiosa]ALR04914.1 hypothetical protein XFPR_10060 [Xylella fastidiosa]ALR07257.1 hypothetical protein XFHB_10785 [Xylella fastidiosa]